MAPDFSEANLNEMAVNATNAITINAFGFMVFFFTNLINYYVTSNPIGLPRCLSLRVLPCCKFFE